MLSNNFPSRAELCKIIDINRKTNFETLKL